MDKWQYYGLFLTEESKTKLVDFILSDKYPKELFTPAQCMGENAKAYLDHCTLLHKSHLNNDDTVFLNRAIKARLDYLLENNIVEANVMITAIGISEKAMAFRVVILNNSSGIYDYEICANEIPHITICTFNGGKPVDSNMITDWHDLDEPIIIKTILKRV